MAFSKIIFDMDGTLIQTDHLIDQSRAMVCKSFGLPSDLIDGFYGQNARQFYGGLLERLGRQDVHIESLLLASQKSYESLLKDGVRLYPGVTALLDRCASNAIPMAIYTNETRREQEMVIRSTGLIDYPRIVRWTADDVARPKPDPEGYLYVLEQIGGTPADTIILEDSWTGLMAGINSGIPTYATLKTLVRKDMPEGIAGVIERYEELQSIISA